MNIAPVLTPMHAWSRLQATIIQTDAGANTIAEAFVQLPQTQRAREDVASARRGASAVERPNLEQN